MMELNAQAFHGPARLVSRARVHLDRKVTFAFGIAGGAFALLVLAAPFLPTPPEALRDAFGSIFGVVSVCFVGWYLRLLAQAFDVEYRDVTVAADARGLFLDGALVAPRAALRVATLRLGVAPSTDHTQAGTLHLRGRPPTVEIVVEGRAWNLDLGDLDRAAALLRALGFAPTTILATQPYPVGSALA